MAVTIAGMGKKKTSTDRHVNPTLGLRLNAELVRLFRSLAAKNRRTLTAELSIAMEQHLKENGIVPPSPPDP